LAWKTDAARLQAQASDQWAYYQAKGIQATLAQVAQQAWRANNKEPPVQLVDSEQHCHAEQRALEQHARRLERERDAKAAAEVLLHHHHGFAYAVTLFQVAIALGAVAALTRATAVWIGSLVVGMGGVFLVLSQLLRYSLTRCASTLSTARVTDVLTAEKMAMTGQRLHFDSLST
jgi:hypothetical protein